MMVASRRKNVPVMPKNMNFNKRASEPSQKSLLPAKTEGSSKLDELQKRLQSLDKQIEEAKGNDQVREMESKIDERQRYLEKLRREKNSNQSQGFSNQKDFSNNWSRDNKRF